MADAFPITPLGVSEPLCTRSLSPLERRLASAFDDLEAVIELEPRIAAAGPDDAPALLHRQELIWEEMEAGLRRVASDAAAAVVAGSAEAPQIGTLAFLVHRAVAGAAPDDVMHFATVLDDRVNNWLANGDGDPALLRRACDLAQSFSATFSALLIEPTMDDLAPDL